MTKRKRPKPEVEALRERIAGLSGAILRISASLDVDTVLHEVVDSARALTGARYGVIATVDDAARHRTSSPPGWRKRRHGSWLPGRTRGGCSSISSSWRRRFA